MSWDALKTARSDELSLTPRRYHFGPGAPRPYDPIALFHLKGTSTPTLQLLCIYYLESTG